MSEYLVFLFVKGDRTDEYRVHRDDVMDLAAMLAGELDEDGFNELMEMIS